MLYAIMLTYIRPADEVHAHLDTHRDWLIEFSKKGSIIVAGPLEDRSGGAILAHCKDREELDAMLVQDSFHVHKLVAYEIKAFTGALRAEAFPATWALDAKAV